MAEGKSGRYAHLEAAPHGRAVGQERIACRNTATYIFWSWIQGQPLVAGNAHVKLAFSGVRDRNTLMQAYQIASPHLFRKYVIVSPNRSVKLSAEPICRYRGRPIPSQESEASSQNHS
jgi:hypothetical protein